MADFMGGTQAPPTVHSDRRLGCPECDLLLRVPAPGPGETARCPRCRCLLANAVGGGFSRSLAFAVTALILLFIAIVFPFIAINAAGRTNTITLATAVVSLLGDDDFIAILLAVFVLVIPGAIMAAAALLATQLLQRRPSRWLVPLARNLFRIRVWYMADVFAVGVIVSLVKLTTLADIAVGAAFWAYLSFAVCFLLSLSSLDRLAVWSAIESLEEPA